MTSKPIYLSLIPLIILLIGCGQKTTPVINTSTQSVVDICLQACQTALAANTNLEAGPCLLNPVSQDTNWVCDVAHNPRQAVDNLTENQCSAYRAGTAKHFVEITPDCQLIKIN